MKKINSLKADILYVKNPGESIFHHKSKIYRDTLDIIKMEKGEYHYINLQGDIAWRNGEYIEHPLRKNHLIAREAFAEYILSEKIIELYDYVTSRMPIKHLIVALVERDAKDFKSYANGQIGSSEKPNKEKRLELEAYVSKYSNKKFVRVFGATHQSPSTLKNGYVWIDRPPFNEFKAAVDKGAESFAYLYNFESNFEIGGKVMFCGNGVAANYKNGSFSSIFVEYEKAGLTINKQQESIPNVSEIINRFLF